MSKIQIGSKYEGPAFDRPALRQLPPGWVLDEPKRQPKLHKGDSVVLILCLLLGLAAVIQSAWSALR